MKGAAPSLRGVFGVAIALARRGIAVLPCVPNEKRPLTTHGVHDATCEVAVVEQWARAWPNANLAIATGRSSGLIVIDVDCKGSVDGHATLAGLEQRWGRLPATLRVATPSGGEHLYFRAPEIGLRNSVGRIGDAHAPGVDLRGENGYVLCPPSGVDGRAYEWIHKAEPAKLDSCWLRGMTADRSSIRCEPLSRPSASGLTSWCLSALKRECAGLAVVPRGQRNARLWASSAALGGLVHVGVFTADDVRCSLLSACSRWGERSPSKDRQTLERGLLFGLNNPRKVSPNLEVRHVA